MTPKLRHMRRMLVMASAALLFFLLPAGAAWAGILIIANPQADITHLNQEELKSIYLNRPSTWPNGLEIKVTMLTADGPLQEFCQELLNKSASQLKRHWRHQLYTGKALPPAELKTSSEVIHYIRTTPGSLGFIADQPQPKGVVAITITP